METTEKLFSDFAPVTKEQWKAKAIEDLKGADYDKKLVWKTDDNFPVQPFYTSEDVKEEEILPAQKLSALQTERTWINYAHIPVTDPQQANSLALEMAKFGATGLLFNLKDLPSIDLSILLDQLDLESCAISFCTSRPDISFIKSYLYFLQGKKVNLDKIKGFYETDVLHEWTTKGIEPDFASLYEIIKLSQAAPSFKTLVIKSHAFIDAGSNTTQELSFTLNKLTDYIDKLSEKGIPIETLAENLMLHMSIGGDYFFEIAKLRSLKLLIKSILGVYGIEKPVEILSSNSYWSKSFYDPNVNMLRNTTEAMSALLGGCDALLTLPHDSSYNEPTKFSQRVALNISNLLKEESYFDKIVDPAAGSYYLENLTTDLSAHSLSLFQEIEENGGFIECFRKGIIQAKIIAVKNKKEKDIASRKRVYVGTNKYPNLREQSTFDEAGKTLDGSSIPLLVPQHAAASFEQLRNRTLLFKEQNGFVPKVYLACFGNLAMRKARASFATEFFGTAGFEIQGEFYFPEAKTAAEESARSNADIVVICSSDQDYESSAAGFVQTFKEYSKTKILVLAGYPEKIADELKKEGVDTFIHIKSDAIEILSDFQSRLFKTFMHKD